MIKTPLVCISLLFVLCASITPSAAQLTVLHHFGSDSNAAAEPRSSLIVEGDKIYGTTVDGGGFDLGTVFNIKTDGSDFQLLHAFSGADGRHSMSGPLLIGSNLYGTTLLGGASDDGTIFRLNTDGTNLETLHSFDGNAGGKWGQAQPTLSGGILYGATRAGGDNDAGTVYKMNLDGTGFTILHRLAGSSTDGALPHEVVVDGSTIYSATGGGGQGDGGVIFKLNTDGTGHDLLKEFTAAGVDGSFISASPILVDSTLFGTTISGGVHGKGVIYRMDTDGTDFTVLHDFADTTQFSSWGAHTRLIATGSSLYGMTARGGASDSGTIFRIQQDGSDFEVLHSFSGLEGTSTGRLTMVDSTLYGTRRFGGQYGRGTLFSFQVPEPGTASLATAAMTMSAFFIFRRHRYT